jgi:hypothetical protein
MCVRPVNCMRGVSDRNPLSIRAYGRKKDGNGNRVIFSDSVAVDGA